MHGHMIEKKNEDVDLYTWTRPPSVPEIAVAESYEQVRKALSDPAYKSDFEDRLYDVLKGPLTVRVNHMFNHYLR